MEISKIGKFIETESRHMVTRGWGREHGSNCQVGTWFPLGLMKNSMEIDTAEGSTAVKALNALNCALEHGSPILNVNFML